MVESKIFFDDDEIYENEQDDDTPLKAAAIEEQVDDVVNVAVVENDESITTISNSDNSHDNDHYSQVGNNNNTVSLNTTTTTTCLNKTNESKQDHNDHQQQQQEQEDRARVVAAGVASGVVGLLLGGPIVGLVLGCGTSYFCSKSNNSTNIQSSSTIASTTQNDTAVNNDSGVAVVIAMSDAARAIGDVALTAHAKACKINEKHQFVTKSTHAIQNVLQTTQCQIIDQNHTLKTLQNQSIEVWTTTCNATRDFEQRHQIVQRGVHGVEQVMEWCTAKINKNIIPQQQQQQQQQDAVARDNDGSINHHSINNPNQAVTVAKAAAAT